jgi:hypothetical protein
LVYGGACSEGVDAKLLKDHISLIEAMGLEQELKFACPNSSHRDMLLKGGRKYRTPGTIGTLWTGEWRQFIQAIVQKKLGVANSGDTSNESSKKKDKVVVYIRRGDVSPCLPSHSDNYLANSYYIDVLQTHITEPAEVEMYSQSDSFENFDDFAASTQVRLDAPAADVWKALATADVAVLSKSSFSFVPALLNPKARVLYATFKEKPLSDWTKVNNDIVDASKSFVKSHQDRKSCRDATP